MRIGLGVDMARKSALIDSEGFQTGNSWNRASTEEAEEGFTQSLFEQEEGCNECGYDGPLRSTRKGWKCPECRRIVIPLE